VGEQVGRSGPDGRWLPTTAPASILTLGRVYQRAARPSGGIIEEDARRHGYVQGIHVPG
jgi:hypothetical protein